MAVRGTEPLLQKGKVKNAKSAVHHAPRQVIIAENQKRFHSGQTRTGI